MHLYERGTQHWCHCNTPITVTWESIIFSKIQLGINIISISFSYFISPNIFENNLIRVEFLMTSWLVQPFMAPPPRGPQALWFQFVCQPVHSRACICLSACACIFEAITLAACTNDPNNKMLSLHIISMIKGKIVHGSRILLALLDV